MGWGEEGRAGKRGWEDGKVGGWGDGRKGGKLLHKGGVVKRREAKWKIAPLGGGGDRQKNKGK